MVKAVIVFQGHVRELLLVAETFLYLPFIYIYFNADHFAVFLIRRRRIIVPIFLPFIIGIALGFIIRCAARSPMFTEIGVPFELRQ